MRVALVDIGTNAVRYLISRRKGDDWTDEETGGLITRLGADAGDGNLTVSAMNRTVQAVSDLVRRLRSKEPNRIFLFATEAVRSSKNGEALVQRVRAETGLPVRVLSEEEEATLSFIGATSGLTLGHRSDARFGVADVGGGSTEISVGTFGDPQQCLSYPIGSQTLTETFLRTDPPEPAEKEQAFRHARTVLAPARWLLQGSDILLLAGGTACNLAILRLNLTSFDPQRIHGLPIRWHLIDYWLTLLSSVPTEQRKQVKGLEPGRELVIVGGLILLQVILELAGRDTALISARSVLHGALYSLV